MVFARTVSDPALPPLECTDQMRCYEHTFIARQDLSPQQAQALAETYTGVLTEHGAEVTKSEYWGLRNLAYRIRKNRKGHYLHLNLRASPEAIDELEDTPSMMMQTRAAREDRSRRSHDDDDRPRRARSDETERPRRPSEDSEKREGRGAESAADSPAKAEAADGGAS
jgi:small subunit ribosomal protein S6